MLRVSSYHNTLSNPRQTEFSHAPIAINITVVKINTETVQMIENNHYNFNVESQSIDLIKLVQWISESEERWGVLYRLKKFKKMDGNISMRCLDYFLVNYCKAFNVEYEIADGVMFNVYNSYQNSLKAYHKMKFDIFCRTNITKSSKRKRTTDQTVEFIVTDENQDTFLIKSNLRQLNMLKWIIENKILEYMNNNIDAIKEDMKITFRKKKIKSIDGRGNVTNKKRKLKRRRCVLEKISDKGVISLQ